MKKVKLNSWGWVGRKFYYNQNWNVDISTINLKLSYYLISVECNPQAFIDNIGKVMETLPCLVVNIFLLFYKNQDKHI